MKAADYKRGYELGKVFAANRNYSVEIEAIKIQMAKLQPEHRLVHLGFIHGIQDQAVADKYIVSGADEFLCDTLAI